MSSKIPSLHEKNSPPEEVFIRKKRKKHDEEADETHGELNLTAMIDMMTILLVFLLKSYSVSSTNINLTDIAPPKITKPEAIIEATKITLTPRAVLIDEKPINLPGGTKLGLVQSEKLDGYTFDPRVVDPQDDHLIPVLKLRLEEIAAKERKLKEKQKKDLHSKILIIADADVPFFTIAQVIRTAGQVSITLKNPDGSPLLDERGQPAKDGWFDEYRFVVVTSKQQ